MSFSRPLSAARPQRQRERDAILRRTRDEVRQRAGGRCELCGSAGTDLCHGFGRGSVIGQPLCDHPSLCWWGCRSCHDCYDGRDKAWSREPYNDLAWRLVNQALAAFDAPAVDQPYTFAIDAVRWLERRLRDTGQIHGREWA